MIPRKTCLTKVDTFRTRPCWDTTAGGYRLS